MVVLDVSVLDQDRRPVRGLKASDFTVLEDGQPQKVSSFEAFDFEDPVPSGAAGAVGSRRWRRTSRRTPTSPTSASSSS